MPSVTENRDEITQNMYRYGHTWDNQDAEGWADVFTEDGYYYDGGGKEVVGREALVAYARQFGPDYSGRFHIVTNPFIAVEGDTAKAHSYFLIVEGLTPCLSGTYDDQVVRTPKGWRIKRRVVSVLHPAEFVDVSGAYGGAPGTRYKFPIAGHDMAAWVLSPSAGGGWQHRRR